MSKGMIGTPIGNSRIGCFVQAVELAAEADRRTRAPAAGSRGGRMDRVRSAGRRAGLPVPAAVLIGCLAGAAVLASLAA